MSRAQEMGNESRYFHKRKAELTFSWTCFEQDLGSKYSSPYPLKLSCGSVAIRQSSNIVTKTTEHK